jgi:hypothetical protein
MEPDKRPRQKLCEILSIYGKDVGTDHKRVRALLNDFCGGNCPEINFLLTALEEQIYTELMTSSKTISYEILSARLVKRLCTNRGMTEEIARWTVISWALALGIISSETPYTELQEVSSAPLSANVYTAESSANPIALSTIIVSPTGEHYTSIRAALESAGPTTTILVKPGHYHEEITITRQVEIKGDGPRENIIIEGQHASCIQMQANEEAVVQGLTLRCSAARMSKNKHAVDITRGHLKLVACDITSDTWACVGVRGSLASCEIQNCRLHDAEGSGLLVEKDAHGTIEECDIFGNGYPNISILRGAHLFVKECRIHDGRSQGIHIGKDSSGIVEDCHIFGNDLDGVKVKTGGTATVRRCCIYNNGRQDAWVYQNGMENTGFAGSAGTWRTSQRKGHPEPRSEATSRGAKYVAENAAAYQWETTQQPKRKQGFFGSLLHSIRFNREK